MSEGEGGQEERGRRNFPAARLIALRNLKRVAAAIEMDCERARCSSRSTWCCLSAPAAAAAKWLRYVEPVLGASRQAAVDESRAESKLAARCWLCS